MSYRNHDTLIWLLFLGLFALSITAANVVVLGDSGEGTAMAPDPYNPGQQVTTEGDIYYREKCYCEADPSWPLKAPEAGAYFRIQYFNHYHQLYFSLEFICKTEIGVRKEDDKQCSPSFEYDDDSYFRMKHISFYACITYNNQTGYEWCYEASRDYMCNDQSWVGPDGVKPRVLFYVGDGNMFGTQAEVVEYCDMQCKERVDPGLTAYKPWAPGRTLNEDRVDYYNQGWTDKFQ
jgi:hypothetical protein